MSAIFRVFACTNFRVFAMSAIFRLLACKDFRVFAMSAIFRVFAISAIFRVFACTDFRVFAMSAILGCLRNTVKVRPRNACNGTRCVPALYPYNTLRCIKFRWVGVGEESILLYC